MNLETYFRTESSQIPLIAHEFILEVVGFEGGREFSKNSEMNSMKNKRY